MVLSGIISVAWPLVQRYAKPALILILGLSAGAIAFHYWKSSLVEQGYAKATAECAIERDAANTEAIEAYQESVEALITKNRKNQEEFENALNIYANRPADVVIERVPVRVKASCSSGDQMSGSTKGGQGDLRVGGQSSEAELSQRAARSLAEMINAIQKLQNECLLVKEAQRINQGALE